VDGTFGSQTQTALIAFQRANGLEADGVVGPQTQEALDRLQTDRRTVLQEGDEGVAVRELQNLLRNAGYFNDATTGFFGPITTAAVTQFQRVEGLPVDGVAGPITLAALRGPQPTPPASTPGTFNTLRQGSNGDRVVRLQTRLRDLGFFNGAATGFYGPATEAAVVRFQTNRGLTVDGIAGPTTLAALGEAGIPISPQSTPVAHQSSSSSALKRGSSGDGVEALQTQLQTLGFYTGEPTGFYGPTTEAAVTNFQQSQGLAVDGIAGSQTRVALARAMNNQGTNNSQTPATEAPVVAPEPVVPVTSPSSSNVSGTGASSVNVLALQERLKKLGFYSGPLDGVPGPATDAAIRAAQEHYGITGNEILYE